MTLCSLRIVTAGTIMLALAAVADPAWSADEQPDPGRH